MPDAGSAPPDARFWAGRRVLITGHTGFKGAWLALWLHELGAAVTGFGGPPNESRWETVDAQGCLPVRGPSVVTIAVPA